MKPGDVLRTRWQVKGTNIPTGTNVTVREVVYWTKTGKPTKNPKSAADTRVGVEYRGSLYWLNPEDFEGMANNPGDYMNWLRDVQRRAGPSLVRYHERDLRGLFVAGESSSSAAKRISGNTTAEMNKRIADRAAYPGWSKVFG